MRRGISYDIEWDVVYAASIMALGGLILTYGLLQTIWGASAEKACLKAGYPGHKLDWTLNAYCVKRVDQTDIVVPLGEVKK